MERLPGEPFHDQGHGHLSRAGRTLADALPVTSTSERAFAITSPIGRPVTPPRIRTRSGRRPRARVHASWSPAGRLRNRRTIVRAVGVLGALLAVTLIGVNVYAVSFLDNLPSVRNVDPSQWSGDTFIQDRNGQLLADISAQGDRRVNVGLDQIAPKLVQGTISIEDRTFWTNPGFDTQAIIRTAATDLRAGGVAGGASTITQQLAKQL